MSQSHCRDHLHLSMQFALNSPEQGLATMYTCSVFSGQDEHVYTLKFQNHSSCSLHLPGKRRFYISGLDAFFAGSLIVLVGHTPYSNKGRVEVPEVHPTLHSSPALASQQTFNLSLSLSLCHARWGPRRTTSSETLSGLSVGVLSH